ncbi:hypothetical protein BDN70DRAFT_938080 [Pholiota conissans]|uniref:Uncharacterized protein n=1 Tax=Pholiota conissans TaxID=109636 RepID=A0A9P5YRZ6_9AGAR|nr:hypothetical protein BDN70DRAFT_938080 [Pholiota conissans]
MGKRWTTPQQERWLQERMPSYISVRKTNKLSRFFVVTEEKWFQHFSERAVCFPDKAIEASLDEEEAVILQNAIKKRKAQLRDWYKNNSRKFMSTIEPLRKESELLEALNLEATKYGKPERAPQRVEAYGYVFPDKVKSACEAEVARLEASTNVKLLPGALLQIRRDESAKLLEADTPENLKKVDDYIAKWREEHANVKVSAEDPDPSAVPLTPEQYQKSIDTIPALLTTLLTALSRASGWSFVVLCGGPVPKEGGKVFVEDHHFGPVSIAGNNFHAAHIDFERDIERPFCEHILNCYSPEVRASRAIIRPRTTRGVDAELAVSNATRGVDAAQVLMSPLPEDGNDSCDDDKDDNLDQCGPMPAVPQALVRDDDLDRLTPFDACDREASTIPSIHQPTALAPPNGESTLPSIRPMGSSINKPQPSSALESVPHHFPDAQTGLDYIAQPLPSIPPAYGGPQAPGGPTEHISLAFLRMGQQPVIQQAPKTPTVQGSEHAGPQGEVPINNEVPRVQETCPEIPIDPLLSTSAQGIRPTVGEEERPSSTKIVAPLIPVDKTPDALIVGAEQHSAEVVTTAAALVNKPDPPAKQKRKAAEPPMEDDSISKRRGRREIRPPARADKDVEALEKSAKKKSGKAKK